MCYNKHHDSNFLKVIILYNETKKGIEKYQWQNQKKLFQWKILFGELVINLEEQ